MLCGLYFQAKARSGCYSPSWCLNKIRTLERSMRLLRHTKNKGTSLKYMVYNEIIFHLRWW